MASGHTRERDLTSRVMAAGVLLTRIEADPGEKRGRFVGLSRNRMLFLCDCDISSIRFIRRMNTDFAAIEIIRSLAGSIWIVLTATLVAEIISWLLTRCLAQRPSDTVPVVGPVPGEKMQFRACIR